LSQLQYLGSPALQGLQEFSLSSNKATNAGLKELASLKELQKLEITSFSEITDAGLKQLESLLALRDLSLRGSKVTDAGLKDLAQLKNLQRLDLSLTGVTDAGLNDLAPLQGLRELILDDTQVTEAGLKTLREAHPNCRVSLNLDFTNATRALREADAMRGPMDVAFQRELKQVVDRQKARWDWLPWILNWRSLLFVIVAAGAVPRIRANPDKPTESRKTRPFFFFIGGIVACAGISLYLFAMSAEGHPLLPVGAIAVVFVGLLLFLPGLPVSDTRTRQ